MVACVLTHTSGSRPSVAPEPSVEFVTFRRTQSQLKGIVLGGFARLATRKSNVIPDCQVNQESR